MQSATQNRYLQWGYRGYIFAFFIYLALPLLAAGTFAFNDSMFPSLPWNGFTMDWFFADTDPKIGMFNDRRIMNSIGISFSVALVVSLLAICVGTTNAFLFERMDFPFKNFCYLLMIIPLVIPGVILGISILVNASTIANGAEDNWGWDIEFLRPGITLVILGQFAFVTTISSLVIAARLKKFDMEMEEAALNLGASRAYTLRTITLPFLRPAILGAGVVAFLISFENFNTTLMLVGSDAPLTITMYDRMAKVGSTPVLNAVSVFLMIGSGALALLSVYVQRNKE